MDPSQSMAREAVIVSEAWFLVSFLYHYSAYLSKSKNNMKN